MACSLEVGAQLLEVVDLAVQDDDDRPIFVEDGLISGRKVDHAQSLNAQADPVLEEDTPRVRPSMFDHRAHLLE
jgi:hypothetical protein